MRDDFAIFIMVHGRPDKMWTSFSLRKCGYTGKIYYVADDLDSTLQGYKEKYKDDLIVFNKKSAALKYDSGDNTGDLRSTLYAANTIFELARERGIVYFMIMCDDYLGFTYKYDEYLNLVEIPARRLDDIVDVMIEYFDGTNCLTLAMAQMGDFIGGKNSEFGKGPSIKRKAMNIFLCSIDRPFQFMGRLNEDVTTYVNLGNKGYLFFTISNVAIHQTQTQSQKGGITEAYLDSGTYTKSFFSVMYNPSCVKVSMMGEQHKRLHHRITWKNAVPCILNEKYKVIQSG